MHKQRTHLCLLLLVFLSVVGVSRVWAQEAATDKIASTLNQIRKVPAGEKEEALHMMGMPDMSSFSLAKIIAWTIFGSIGFIAFIYGKKQEEFKPLLFGIALMGYAYFFSSTLWLYVVGIGLCLGLYFFRD